MPEWITSAAVVFLERLQAMVSGERRAGETIYDTVQRLVDERARLRDLIETYASTPMPYEAFVEAALGEARAAEIFHAQSEKRAAIWKN